MCYNYGMKINPSKRIRNMHRQYKMSNRNGMSLRAYAREIADFDSSSIAGMCAKVWLATKRKKI